MTSQNGSKSKASAASSLLDILMKSEEPTDEPDPLEAIGNIGDEVIVRLSGAMDSGQDLMQNALKMFDEVMAYSRQPQVAYNPQPARKQSRHQRKRFTPLQVESSVKQFHQNDMKAGFSPRTKFESGCSELFQHGQTSDAQFQFLHKKLEKERSQQFDDLVNRDVERLLSSASRIYGPREWTTEEKTEFANYCRNLRSGTLSEEDKKSLQNFYAKAYQESSLGTDQEDVKDFLATKSAIFFPEQLKALKKEEESEEMMDVKKTVKEEIEEEEEEVEGSITPPPVLPPEFPCSLDSAQIGNFDPGTKYEKEKEFRLAASNIFAEVVNERIKQSVPTTSDRYAVYVRESGLKEDLKTLSIKLNELMQDENKQWTPVEIVHLKGYLDMFKERMQFTIIQTKEFGMFLRKTYGRLQQYEIERENDTALQEKRKYWQEYAKTHGPVKKEKVVRAHPTRPYIKSNLDTKGETHEARRLRKAAYLRQWRLAQKEKQFYANMFGTTIPKPGGSS